MGHKLISTIGLGAMGDQDQSYCWNGHACTARHSGFALYQLLSEASSVSSPEEILFIRVPDSTIRSEQIEDTGKKFQSLSITVINQDALSNDRWLHYRSIQDFVDHSSCVFDITGCPEALLVSFLSIAFIRNASDIDDRTAKVFLGRQSDSADSEIVFQRLAPLLNLSGWPPAFETLQKHLEPGPLADRVEELHDLSYTNSDLPTSVRLQQLAGMIRSTTNNLTSSLPIEAGSTGSDRDDQFWTEVREDTENLNPLMDELIEDFRTVLKEVTLDESTNKKEDLILNEQELQRQLRIAERLCNTENLLPGFLLARELLVNGAILGTNNEVEGPIWLDGNERARAAAPFYLINHWMRYDQLRTLPGEKQRHIARVWEGVKKRRNELAHAGFTRNSIRMGRLKHELQKRLRKIQSLVLEEREQLDTLLEFPFSGHQLLYPVTNQEDKTTSYLNRLVEEVDKITTIRLLTTTDSATDDVFLTCRQTAERLAERVQTRVIPDSKQKYEFWETYWKQNRKDLLQNRKVTVISTGGSPLIEHTVRKLHDRIAQFGIQNEFIGIEQRGERKVNLVTIDRHRTPS